MLRNGREGIRKIVEQYEREKGKRTEEAVPADAPKKVLKVRPLSQIKEESNAAASEKGEMVFPHRQEVDVPKGFSFDLPKEDPPPRKKGPRFEETHVRFTNYMQKDLYAEVQALKRAGEIESVTALMDASVREYLSKHFAKFR